MYKKNTASKLRLFINSPEIAVFQIGRTIVTNGTGEGCFAYPEREVKAYLKKAIKWDYEEFVQQTNTINTRRTAFRVARELSWSLCESGSCNQILSDVEFRCAFFHM